MQKHAESNAQHVTESVTDQLVVEGLFTTITNVNFNDETIRNNYRKRSEKRNMRLFQIAAYATAKCGNTDDYDVTKYLE